MQDNSFNVESERFDEIRILRYQVPDFETLPLNHKILIYYLSQAALWGRDILWDQNYKHNLLIRKALETILLHFTGDRLSTDFNLFLVYAKKVFFANGIHHHYSMDKFYPECSRQYFEYLSRNLKPTDNQNQFDLLDEKKWGEIIELIFSNDIATKRVSLNPDGDLVKDSACNFYENVSQAEAEAFYSAKHHDDPKISHGLNSTLIKKDGIVSELVWKKGGKYSGYIEKMMYFLNKAIEFSDDHQQVLALKKLVEFYETGDLSTFDDYSILWLNDTNSTIDIIHGFIEVYGDPLGKKATYESVISIIDSEASERSKLISTNAQWFENHSTTDNKYKKDEIKGVTARAVHVVMEAGDCSPATPIGINLPNADWIRAEHGSKSITITNIIDAYDEASKENGSIEEFAFSEEEIEWHNRYGGLASKLHVDLHEIVGHGSGKLASGVADPSETLKNYASTIEEARADLVALYFGIDEQLVQWGLMPDIEAGYAEYNSYIRSGLLTQLVRIKPGKDLEESHMRNRQLIANWAYINGKPNNTIEKVIKNNKTYFVIIDYKALRNLFGELLREVQRIKSEGDFDAAKNLVETYGVKVDSEIHNEVLNRWKKLNIPPYSGFLNPHYELIVDDNQITDVKIHYPNNFLEQMLHYGKNYSL